MKQLILLSVLVALSAFVVLSSNKTSMKTEKVIEWAPFELKDSITHEDILAASKVLQTEFLAKQKGFIKRQLLKKSDREYVDMVEWESMEDAKLAAKHAYSSNTCMQYFSLMKEVDNPEESVYHFTLIETY